MTELPKGAATQVRNIEGRTGKSLDQLIALVRRSGLAKHAQVVGMLKTDLAMGHGDANLIATLAKQPQTEPAAGDPLDALYVGPKSVLRPIHEALLARMAAFGSFETAPKQKYVSYRRKKQFAMIGPATSTRVDLGLNIKSLPASPRLEALPAGQMCSYRMKLTNAGQVDAEVAAWLRAAFDAAG